MTFIRQAKFSVFSLPLETVSQLRKCITVILSKAKNLNLSCHLLKRDPSAIASG